MLDLNSINNTCKDLKSDKDKFNEFAIEIIPLLIKEVGNTRMEVVHALLHDYENNRKV